MKTNKKVKSLGKTRGAQPRARIKNPNDSTIKGFEKLFLHIDQTQNPYVWTLDKIKNQKLLKDVITLTPKIIETYFDQLYFQIYKFTSKEEKYIIFLNLELPEKFIMIRKKFY